MMKRLMHLTLAAISCMIHQGCEHREESGEKQVISKHRVVYTQPANRIPARISVDAPMMGNGYTGIAISGPSHKQVYYIARNDFWRLKNGYNESFPAVLGKLEISIPGLEGSTYRIEQDLYEAKTWSQFSKSGCEVRFKTYVSATEDLMIIEIALDGEGELKGSVDLELPGEPELASDLPEGYSYPAETLKGTADSGIGYIWRAFVEDVEVATKAVCAYRVVGGSDNTFILTKGEPVTIVVAFSSNFKSENCLAAVKKLLSGFDQRKALALEKAHEAWWQEYWSMSYVDINDDPIEKQYYLSNYNLACFSRDQDFPPSIFGTCITRERPAWNGDYHLNYNHMAPYYGLYSSNHIQQADPYNAPVLAMTERGKFYSNEITGIEEGIMLPVGIGPLGIETTRENRWMREFTTYKQRGLSEAGGLFFNQKSNSSYCVVNMAMQFYHTYDQDYTKRVYPFVKGVATFWENYLEFENGRFVIYSDAIHEGSGENVNPILSLGLIRLVMQTAIDMSKELDADTDRTENWQHVLDHLSGYTYQERDGKEVFRYTEEGTAWWENNTLGIQHIYPGGQIGPDSDPELLRVARNTIEVMQRWLDINGSNSFFPAAVRVAYDPDTILAHMHRYIEHTYPNGYQLDNPHGIENLSTVPNTINEMLCMSHGGVIRIFPVWPKRKDASFHTLRTRGAFLVSSQLKQGVVQYVKIESEKGKKCIVENPWPGSSVTFSSNRNKEQVLKGDRLEFGTEEGEKVILKINVKTPKRAGF